MVCAVPNGSLAVILLLLNTPHRVSLAFQATTASFSPALPRPTTSFSVIRVVTPRTKRNILPIVSLSNENENIADDDAGPGLAEESNHSHREPRGDVNVTERLRILAYRGALLISALLLTAEAVFGSDFLSGTGLDGASIAASAESCLPLVAGVSLLLAPVPERIQAATIAVGFVVIVSSGARNLLHVSEEINGILPVLSNGLGLVSLCGIGIREIYYFGLAYKWEAAVALVSLPLLLIGHSETHDNLSGIAAHLSALAVSVLAVGKVFEPCVEDFVKSNSEFFVQGDINRK